MIFIRVTKPTESKDDTRGDKRRIHFLKPNSQKAFDLSLCGKRPGATTAGWDFAPSEMHLGMEVCTRCENRAKRLEKLAAERREILADKVDIIRGIARGDITKDSLK